MKCGEGSKGNGSVNLPSSGLLNGWVPRRRKENEEDPSPAPKESLNPNMQLRPVFACVLPAGVALGATIAVSGDGTETCEASRFNECLLGVASAFRCADGGGARVDELGIRLVSVSAPPPDCDHASSEASAEASEAAEDASEEGEDESAEEEDPQSEDEGENDNVPQEVNETRQDQDRDILPEKRDFFQLGRKLDECRCTIVEMTAICYASYCPSAFRGSPAEQLVTECSTFKADRPLRTQKQRKRQWVGDVVNGVLGGTAQAVAGATEAAALAALLNVAVQQVPNIVNDIAGNSNTKSNSADEMKPSSNDSIAQNCAISCADSMYKSLTSASQASLLSLLCTQQGSSNFASCLKSSCQLGSAIDAAISSLCASGTLISGVTGAANTIDVAGEVAGILGGLGGKARRHLHRRVSRRDEDSPRPEPETLETVSGNSVASEDDKVQTLASFVAVPADVTAVAKTCAITCAFNAYSEIKQVAAPGTPSLNWRQFAAVLCGGDDSSDSFQALRACLASCLGAAEALLGLRPGSLLEAGLAMREVEFLAEVCGGEMPLESLGRPMEV
ncbi:hypothetical protein BC830DRAFT_1171913 [Chytriomyces sp. MP71]|nr:hypothetical protein BC830DRAFT_1171913 [Chytriomyces sp. MP71]